MKYIFALACCTIVALSTACIREPLRPHRGDPTPPPLGAPDIDITPQWSHNGQLIAYQRLLPSSDGPPGIYLVSAWGGVPRFIAPSGFCEFVRFSPDDRFLAIDRDRQLVVIDLANGASRQPIFATFGITAPDWSPDGRTIAYQRLGSTSSAPIESIGIHLVDLQSGVERALAFHDTLQLGTYPVWSPDGAAIAVRQNLITNWRIALIRTDGTTYRTLLDSAPGAAFGPVQRHHDVRWGEGLVIGGQTQFGPGPLFVSWDATVVQDMAHVLADADVYSRDGVRGVGSRYDARDSLTALFTYRVGDITGATYHQITHFAPPTGNASALRLAVDARKFTAFAPYRTEAPK